MGGDCSVRQKRQDVNCRQFREATFSTRSGPDTDSRYWTLDISFGQAQVHHSVVTWPYVDGLHNKDQAN